MKLSLQAVRRRGFELVAERDGITEFLFKRNGLKVLHVENHAAPIVTCMIVYKVGSRNEGVGYTGSTHFLEHLLFKGTPTRNPANGTGVDDILVPMGAFFNATTAPDRTNYFETAPREHRRTLLAMEADRMRNLMLRQEDRDSEMTVVRQELERNENNPSSVMYQQLTINAFQAHPYHHPVIGWTSDVEGVPLSRFKEFYDTFYWPNNATLIVVGDCTADELLSDVRAEFGKISRSPKPIPQVYTTERPQEGERRFEIARAETAPAQAWIAYHVPQANHDDHYALHMLSQILGSTGDPSSRLYKALGETRKAVEGFAMMSPSRDPGLFILGAFAAPGVNPTELEQIIYAEIERIARDGVTDAEMAPIKTANRKGTILSFDSSKKVANMLCMGETVADWQWVLDADDRLDAVTSDDLKAVAAHYFDASNRTVGHFKPIKKKPEDKPAQATPVRAGVKHASTRSSAKAKVGTFASRTKRHVLPNGLTVVAIPSPGSGTVSVATRVRAGSAYMGSGNANVPTAVAELLTMGSVGLNKEDLSKRLKEMSTGIHFEHDHSIAAASSTFVATDLPAYLGLLSKVLTAPDFTGANLAEVKDGIDANIQQAASNTGGLARAALSREIFTRDHPHYEKTIDELAADLQALTVQDCKDFHARQFTPKSTTLTIVGDFDEANLTNLIPDELKQWTGPDVAPVAVPAGSYKIPAAAKRIDIKVPGKRSVDIVVALPAPLMRQSPDFFAARLANAAIGADSMYSRLGKTIRVKEGLTYHIGSAFTDPAIEGSAWLINVSVNPKNVEKALSLINSIVSDYIKTGIDAKRELGVEKGRAFGMTMVAIESTSGLANQVANFEALGLTSAVLDTLKASYDAVTKAEVDAAIRKYFLLDKAVTVVCGTF